MGLKNTYQARKRFTKVPVSKTGMWYQDGDVVVPSNQITMKGPNGESDYFNSPIMGTGMQSGQTQVMYPGREYSFPNDNSVYETKMQIGGKTSTEQNPDKIASIDIKSKMPRVDWYESIDPRNWNLRDYSAVDDYGTAYQRAKLSGQDEFYWKGKRYNTKYAGPINEEIATYGVKGQKVNSKDYITVYQYPYLDRDYFPSHIAADQSAQIAKLAYSPKINYGPSGNMRGIKDDMSLSGRKEYRVYGVDPVTFFKKSQELNREIYKSIGHNWNLVTNNCADNVCDAFGVPRDKFITTPQDAIENISKKYPTLEVTGRKTYQVGGETSTEQNPVRMNPIEISAKRRNQDYKTYQDNTVNNNQIVPSEFRGRRYVQPTLSEYVEPSIGNRILNTLASPMTALSNNRTGSRNPFDYALDMVNPFSWIQSGERAVGSLSEGQYGDAALNALGALPALGFADDAGRALSKAGNYATTQTPLKNAYKYNPLAFKADPKAYYRVLGKEGLDDAFESGVIRASQKNVDEISGEPFYDRPYFSKSVPLDRDFKSPFKNKKGKQSIGSPYPDDTMVEVFGDSRFYPSSNLVTSPINTLTPFDEGVNFYKRDWLQGYKKVNPPKPQKQNGGLQMSYLKTKRFK